MAIEGAAQGLTAEIAEIATFLAQAPPFDRLTDQDIAQVVGEVTVYYRRAGHPHLQIGAPNPTLAVIAKGSAELTAEDGRLVERVGEGGLLGVLSAITQKPVRFAADFIEDSVIYVLSPGGLARARAASPDFDRYMIGVLEQRLVQPEPEFGPSYLDQSCDRLATRELITVGASVAAAQAAAMMREHRVASLVVIDHAGEAVGLVSERMLVQRIVADGRPSDTPVEQVMDRDPPTLPRSASAHQALLALSRHRVRHLPLTDGPDGPPVAMITPGDLLMARANDPVALAARIDRADSPEAIAEITAAVPRLVESLMAADARAETTGMLVTSITDAATRRLCDLAEARLGPPPVAYAFTAFGSQARREQTALTDQDNALILAETPDPAADDYFAELARFVCAGLDLAGYRYCPGDIMATNPKWRVSLDRWIEYVDGWVSEPSPKAVLSAGVFFDVRGVAGTTGLADRFAQAALDRAGGSRLFLGHLAAAAVEFSPPLGFFRRFVVEKDGDQKDTFDLKARGVTPVIETARVLAIEAGVSALNTFERLKALGPTTSLAPDDAADLAVALEHIGYVRLQHQRRCLEAGVEPDNNVRPADLSALERDQLKQAFLVIDRQQDAIARRFGTASVG